jgi:hypothetical protein
MVLQSILAAGGSCHVTSSGAKKREGVAWKHIPFSEEKSISVTAKNYGRTLLRPSLL